jgi:NAD(P)-dependent dehydrogenase (short-subunit alcohol dehydrogenase family)
MPKGWGGTVVVTGASAGVGRAVALAFGRIGWQVGLIARGIDALETACRDVEEAGGRPFAVPADVADADAVMQAAERIEGKLGPIDVWINSAMVTIVAPAEQVTPEEFRRVTEVTYLGQVHGTLAALKHMRPRDRGTIVHVGSALAYRSIPLQAPYCAAKSATRGFVDSLRSELQFQRSRIRLTMVQLPAVNTPQFDWARSRMSHRLAPVAPIFQPDPVADAIVRAAFKAPREYWVGHSAVKAIVAQMVAPGLADRFLARSPVASQTTDQPADRSRPDNMFEAGQGDPGAHGRFDDRSANSVTAFNPAWLRGGLAVAALSAAALLATRRVRSAGERRRLAPPRA